MKPEELIGNREIKFRAWSKADNQMFDESRGFSVHSIFQEDECEPENLTLMQYTGLKDKNGKEIYEGDILFMRESNCIAKFWNYQWRFEPAERSAYIWTTDNAKEGAVIGNIFNNPELIK